MNDIIDASSGGNLEGIPYPGWSSLSSSMAINHKDISQTGAVDALTEPKGAKSFFKRMKLSIFWLGREHSSNPI